MFFLLNKIKINFRVFIILFFSILFLNLQDSYSQELKKGSMNLDNNIKYSKIKKKANKYFKKGDYYAALPELSTLLMKSPEDVELNYKYGKCLLFASLTKTEAIEHLKFASSNGHIPSLLLLGQAYHLNYQFDEAKACYERFKKLVSKNSSTYKKSNVDMHISQTLVAEDLISKPVDVIIENVGEEINSPYPDYVPIITADDQEMFFTSRRENSTGMKLDLNKEYFEDIYFTERDELGQWKPAVHIDKKINTPIHDATAGLSADGHTLLIYRNDPMTGGGDIYTSYQQDTSWTVPVKMSEIINPPDSWEPSASLTANENELYFTSNKVGGFGGRDIYKAKRLPNGEWSNPVNLGSVINTKYDEDGPFIHPDGKTLYFSSRGHYNMGGFDIFKSILSDSGKWSKPENMGYPINTVDDDIYFTITASGEVGYYSSIREDTYGEKDIYAIHMKVADKVLVVLKGKIRSINEKPLAAQVYVFDADDNKLLGVYNSNSKTGKYMCILPPGKSFIVKYSAKDHRPDSLNIIAKEINSFHEIVRDITLLPFDYKPDTIFANKSKTIILSRKDLTLKSKADSILLDSTIVIFKKDSISNDTIARVDANKINKNIEVRADGNAIFLYFDYDDSELRNEDKLVLDSLVKLIRNKKIKFSINGHTDSKGSLKYNMILSQKRAKSVLKYMISKRMYSYDMDIKAFGKEKPIAPNNINGEDNPQGRQQNRRVELIFKGRKGIPVIGQN